MKNELIPLPKLVSTIDDYINGGWGNAIATSLISNYVDGKDLDLKEFFKEIVEEEWVALQLVMAVKDQTNLLKQQLQLIGRDNIVRFKVSNLGVHIYGKN